MEAEVVSVRQAYLLPVGSPATLRGWVRSRRDSKGVTFIELNDGSRFRSMQLVVEGGTVPEETLREVTTGSGIAATGAGVRLVTKPTPQQPEETASDLSGALPPPAVARDGAATETAPPVQAPIAEGLAAAAPGVEEGSVFHDGDGTTTGRLRSAAPPSRRSPAPRRPRSSR